MVTEEQTMRFNDTVKFYSESNRRYNPETSQYEGGITLVDEIKANVTDVGIDREAKLFGKIDDERKIVRLSRSIQGTWSYLTINDGPIHYALTTIRQTLKCQSIVVEALSGGRRN